MNTRFSSGLAVALAAVASSVAAADPVVWDNGPLPSADNGDAYWALYSSTSVGDSVGWANADDFLLSKTTSITAARWSGFAQSLSSGNLPDSFILRFYLSDPSNTTPTNAIGDGNSILTAIATYVIPMSDVTILPDESEIWTGWNLHFAAALPAPLVATAGVHYWFSVQGVFPISGTFATMISTNQQLELPAWSNGDAWDIVDFDQPDKLPPSDLAFVLYGTPVPAPGVIAVLGLAGFVTRRRR